MMVSRALCHDRRIIFYRRYFFLLFPEHFPPSGSPFLSQTNRSDCSDVTFTSSEFLDGGSQPGDASSNYLIGRLDEIAKWKAFKARRTIAGRVFIDSRQVYASLLYDFLDARIRGNNGWLARKGASRASFRNREACATPRPLVNRRRMYLRAQLARLSFTTFLFGVKNDRTSFPWSWIPGESGVDFSLTKIYLSPGKDC